MMISTVKSRLHDKSLLLTLLIAVAVTAIFWAGSRYPDLNQKAAMAGETPFSALGFDTLIDMPPAPSVWAEIAINTANWMYTNWKGMTFGLLAGAILLTLLPHFQGINIRNRFLNSAMGMVMGAPLGVCVNCATPVAQGAISGRAKPELALAILVSSPTLNVIVISLLLSLFPIHMALTKIALTVLFILVIVPVITWAFPALPNHVAGRKSGWKMPFDIALTAPTPRNQPTGGWGAALIFVLGEMARNLRYIFVITVPFMVLAGALGATAVTLIPFGTLENLLPIGGPLAVVFAMGLLVIFALFLPTPMALDVLIAAVLFQAGLPAGYTMTLLFALGIFSIYPFMMIWWQMSGRIAVAMTATLAILGVTGGVFVHVYHKSVLARQEAILISSLEHAQRPTAVPTPLRPSAPRTDMDLLSALKTDTRTPVITFQSRNLSIHRLPHEPRKQAAKSAFTRLEGSALGMSEQAPATYLKAIIPFSRLRTLASGDVHNDGWPDLVVSSGQGLALYSNLSGKRFERQQIDLPQLDIWPIGTVALIDLTNDGWLDLFITTVSNGTWLVENRGGTFSAATLVEIPNNTGAIWTTAPGFADINRDGWLDIVLGNSTYGNFWESQSHPRARNALVMGHEAGWQSTPLPASPAETLSTLLTDLNGDGWVDLMVADDFSQGDVVYLNDAQGNLVLSQKPTELFSASGITSMSLTSADINNDLKPDIFLAQNAWERGDTRELSHPELCSEISEPRQRRACIDAQTHRDIVIPVHQISPRHVCSAWPDQTARADCLALIAYRKVLTGRAELDCAMFDDKWPALAEGCRLVRTMPRDLPDQAAPYRLPLVINRNLLYLNDGDRAYEEAADRFGLRHAGWAWNAKFADIDNDEYQDLFVVTGELGAITRHPNYFYRNKGGEKFINETRAAGLETLLDILSYTYVDYDADGDLDIIAAPITGPVLVFRNDRKNGQSISFSLTDHIGNRSGIGSRIVIRYGNGKAQMRDISASGGHMSFDAPVAHFGLGTHTSVDTVTVTWSTGEQTTINHRMTGGAHYTITRRKRLAD